MASATPTTIFFSLFTKYDKMLHIINGIYDTANELFLA